MKFLFITLLVGSMLHSISVSAETKLCVKKKIKLVKGQLQLDKSLKVVDGQCPKNYVQLISNVVGIKGDSGPKGDTGAKGDQGLKGETGEKGSPGIGFVNGTSNDSVSSQTIASFAAASDVVVQCDGNKAIFAGKCTDSSGLLSIQGGSGASGDGSSWTCKYANLTGSIVDTSITAKIYCSDLT